MNKVRKTRVLKNTQTVTDMVSVSCGLPSGRRGRWGGGVRGGDLVLLGLGSEKKVICYGGKGRYIMADVLIGTEYIQV